MVMATISSMIEYPRGRVGRLSLMRRSVTRGGADGDRAGDQPAEGVAGAVRARPAGERGCCGGDHPLPRDRDLVDARRAHAERWVSRLKLGDAAASAQHAAGVGAGALLAGTLEGVAPLAQIAIRPRRDAAAVRRLGVARSEEHTSELQSPCNLVCRLLLE